MGPTEARACRAVTAGDSGTKPCKRRVTPGSPYCRSHTVSPANHIEGGFEEWRAAALRTVTKHVPGMKRADGDSATGFDSDLVRTLLPGALPFYSLWWRVQVRGVENVPASGPGLLAANHSGMLPADGAMLKIAMLKEHGRNVWLLAADLAFRIPGFGEFVRAAGNARADHSEAVDLLRANELVGVFPEGYKGIGKGWAQRYRLQRFGRGGFARVALETGAPIIPTAIVGAEEAYPMIGNLGSVAKRLGLPYFPITPTWPLLGPLGAIPLPSKFVIAFGEPVSTIEHGPDAAHDERLVTDLTADVRARVQSLVFETLARRGGAFS